MPHPGNGMWRFFSRGKFACHGRAYGWWQSIPGTARASMTINGEPVVEVDYSALHTTILYNVAGVRLNGEPYDVNGFERDHVKLRASILRNRRRATASGDPVGWGDGHWPPATAPRPSSTYMRAPLSRGISVAFSDLDSLLVMDLGARSSPAAAKRCAKGAGLEGAPKSITSSKRSPNFLCRSSFV